MHRATGSHPPPAAGRPQDGCRCWGDLAQDFAQLVRQRQPAPLDPWLVRATTSTLEALRRFAHGLHDAYAAVKAGVTLPWSTGPVEGHINRLKMLKRQM